jgi:predicted CXXCH cytochrome family protein
MASRNKIKLVLFSFFALVFLAWAVSGKISPALGDAVDKEYTPPDLIANASDGDYVGSDSCKACHEEQFNNFAGTKHSRLKNVDSWKNKVQGCESCHGPGKKHLEDATNPANIISFKGKSAKFVSETCLTCHAGKESHNNYRRGEHWRNDVGCTDCHSPHAAPFQHEKAGSSTFVNNVSLENPNQASPLRLKASEPQLCMSCHQETKSQFTKPFHHKVMEGFMKCSDCHNPHGGFEAKQVRLAVGADASCIKCHTNKQGPFVFEHAPLKTEGCSACHTPHGSSNPKMLSRSTVRQMCLECHSAITESSVPNAPSFHNQATVRFKDCTVCHSAIHGSNVNKDFLR